MVDIDEEVSISIDTRQPKLGTLAISPDEAEQVTKAVLPNNNSVGFLSA